MSFSIAKVGAAPDVASKLNALPIQDSLGCAVRDMLVRELSAEVHAKKTLIVKASGHQDASHFSLSVNVETVY